MMMFDRGKDGEASGYSDMKLMMAMAMLNIMRRWFWATNTNTKANVCV